MKILTQYPWVLLLGVYMYVVFQVVFFLQFGSFNFGFDVIDLGIYIVGLVSVLVAQFFMRKLPRKKLLMLIPFVIALPFGYIGSLGGGLLGIIGMVIFGTIPFLVILPIGYVILKVVLKRGSKAAPPEQPMHEPAAEQSTTSVEE